MDEARKASEEGVVAIVPAAGAGTRLGRLPGSKELVPIGFEQGPDGNPRPRPVVVHFLDRLRAGGIGDALVVLRAGKWDLPAYLTDGRDWGMRIAYSVLEHSPHVPYTVASALPWARGRIVALGFPDILYRPRDAFGPLVSRLRASDADLALGLFPTDRTEKTDMVELDATGTPRRLVIKQEDVSLRYTWSIAAWRPGFSSWLIRWVGQASHAREAHFGEAIQDAIDEGLSVTAEVFEDGEYLDVGTPDDLARAQRRALESRSEESRQSR